MAYPLNTFNDAQPAPAPRTGVGRFTQEVVLVLGLALIIFATMALASYSPHDAAWSTSGTGGPLHNWAGKLGRGWRMWPMWPWVFRPGGAWRRPCAAGWGASRAG